MHSICLIYILAAVSSVRVDLRSVHNIFCNILKFNPGLDYSRIRQRLPFAPIICLTPLLHW